MIAYLITTTGSLLLFYALYAAALHRLTFYRWNRFFILTVIALSLLLPLLKMPENPVAAVYRQVPGFTSIGETASEATIAAADGSTNAIAYIYLAGLLSMLLALMLKSWRLYRLFQSGEKERLGSLTIIRTEALNASFFHTIFLQKGLPAEEETMVLRHETAHARQLHSLDNILMELLKVICWFNPAIYFFHRRLRELHEYEADHAAAQLHGKAGYAHLLIRFTTTKDIQLLNLYGSHPVKKRIHSLFQSNTHQMKKSLYLLILPCFALAMYSFSPLTNGSANDSGVVLKKEKEGKRLVIHPRTLLGENASWEALEKFEENTFPELRAAFLEDTCQLEITSKVMGENNSVKELGISLKGNHGGVASVYRMDYMIKNNGYIVIGYNREEKKLYVHGATEKEMKDIK